MANLFDSTNAPEGEPKEVVVGDFIQWKRTDIATDYPPGDYSAEYVARVTGGGASEIKLLGTNQTTHYLFTVSSADSASFEPGEYHWQLEITQVSSGNRVVVDTGDFVANPDLDNNQADPRIHAQIMVDKIEQILAGKADSDTLEYTINGRQLKKYAFQDLIQLRDYYKREIVAHHNKELVKRGKGNGSTIKVRF